MQIARLRFFMRELRLEPSIAGACVSTMVFRLEADEWVDEAGSKVADAELLSSLNATHAAKRHWRPQKSARAYFPVTKYDAIVEATFSNPPRAATRQRFADNVERCVQHSTQAFDADHDLLTGLMNRRRLESEIDAAFASQSSVDPPESVGSLRTASGAPVWLLALDIDHFKQINDTHGHLYGDIVLACFAERVRRVVAAFAAQRTTIAAHVARTGGEEFLVVLVRVEQTDASALAEDIRSVISREPLPSDAEWAALPNRSRVIPLPHASERKVTVSIGCTGVVKATGGDIQELVGRVEAEADTALYRAKASGRDTVRWFSEIVQRGGRVLEHHADTDIVAVDIGRNVGVRVGQEFFVFHPDFAGGTPFLFSDGRSKKKLGSYPKVAMGRVIAFEVQLELAFCRVAQRGAAPRFPSGAVLEAVPLGSIAHLLSAPGIESQFAPDLVQPETLRSFVHEYITTKASFSCVVVAIDDAGDLERARGSAFVNQVLVKLLGAIRAEFPGSVPVAQVQPTQFCFIVKDIAWDAVRASVEATLARISDECSGLVRCGAGCFSSEESAGLAPGHAIDFARYAASQEARPNKATIELFRSETAKTILYSSRTARAFSQALADYENLKRLGVENAAFENHAALAAIGIVPPRAEVAIAAARRAVALDAERDIYRMNLGLVEFGVGDRPKAWQHFAGLEGMADEGRHVYWPAYAMAAYEAFTRGELHDRELVRAALERAGAATPLPVLRLGQMDIANALAALAQTSAA